MIWTEHSAGRIGQGRTGLGRNRQSEWGGHIFKGKMNIIKMITAIHCDVATAPQKLLDKLHPTVIVLERNYNRLYMYVYN